MPASKAMTDLLQAHVELGQRYLWLLSAARNALDTGNLDNLRNEVAILAESHPEDFEGECD